MAPVGSLVSHDPHWDPYGRAQAGLPLALSQLLDSTAV